MTKEEMAALLNGRKYTREMSDREEKDAKNSGLVVIFGGSDDLCEMRGAIYDEAGAPGIILITRNGSLLAEIEEDDAEVLTKHGVYEAALADRQKAIKIEALWCEEAGYSWTYKTDHPHASFDIVEDGEGKYCRGIVIDLSEGK